MTVKEHYDNHLGNFYSWMMGDFETKQKEFQVFLKENSMIPFLTKNAIDLGAGHGLQSIPLAEVGFNVLAVDFNEQLLGELKLNAKSLNIEILNADMKTLIQFARKNPELIVCCGDTLSHLCNKREISDFIKDASNILVNGGKMLLSFRDYSNELTGDSRFIPVKSDDTKILTCILEYKHDTVNVSDLLYKKTEAGWKQKVSSYKKVRLLTDEILGLLKANGMRIHLNQIINRMTTIIAIKL